MRAGEKSRMTPLNPSSKAVQLSFSQGSSNPSVCFYPGAPVLFPSQRRLRALAGGFEGCIPARRAM